MAIRSLSARQLQARLISARNAAKLAARTVREQLEQEIIDAAELSSSGSVSSTSVGSTSTQKAGGSQTITDVDIVDTWTCLLSLWSAGYRWVKWCFTYGLDPQEAEDDRIDSPPNDAVASPTEATDDLIFEWLMGSDFVQDSPRDWIGKIQVVTECRSDYSLGKVGSGLQWT